jgi:hypothetical protein
LLAAAKSGLTGVRAALAAAGAARAAGRIVLAGVRWLAALASPLHVDTDPTQGSPNPMAASHPVPVCPGPVRTTSGGRWLPRGLAAALALGGLGAAAYGQACARWEVVPSPDPRPRAILRDIVAVDQGEIWVVGDYFNGSRIVQFSMRYDGEAWSVHDVPVRDATGSGHLWGIDWFDDGAGGQLWAAGDQQHRDSEGFFGTHVLVVRREGDRWVHVDVPSMGLGASGEFVWDLDIVAADEIWFVGEGFPPPIVPQPSLAMRWDGDRFELTPTPPVNTFTGPGGFGIGNGLRAVVAIAPDDVWAVGAAGDGDPILTDSQIIHWDGSSWTHRPGPVVGLWHSLDAVAAVGPDDVWAAGEYFDGVDYHGLAMHWDGSGWTQVPIPGTVLDLLAIDSDNVLAVGAGVMRWDGSEWTVVERFPEVRGPSLAGITTVPDSDSCEAWAAGRDLIGDDLSTLVVRRPGSTACRADFDGDGALTIFDFLAFQNAFDAGEPSADFDGDGSLTLFDFLAFQNDFDAGCA